jgi:HlyD family secretion protein
MRKIVMTALSQPAGKTAYGGAAPGLGPSYSIRSRVVLASLLAGGLVLGCGGWAAQARLSGAVIAQGQVAVKKQVKQIQHRDGGIVGEILVTNGDHVTAGNVLIRLDDTQTKAELGVLRAQLAEYHGRRARLSAERDGEEHMVFDEGFEVAPTSASVATGELRLFAQNRAMRQSQQEQLALQVVQLEDQVVGLRAQQASNERERAMVGEDLERLRPLVAERLIEGTKIRVLERDLAQIDGSRGEIEANIALVLGQISEKRLKIIELDQTMRADAQSELRDIDAKVSELNERLIAADDRLSRMELRAPISGYVNELAVHTIGGVIASGDKIMSVVPESDDLTVEARLSPADIDQVVVGQTAKLRFSAFNQRTTPELSGQVAVVGASATLDPASGQSYYRSEIVITSDLALLGQQHLVPGMPVEVFLATEERSALSYLVKPFSDQMMKAFREE